MQKKIIKAGIGYTLGNYLLKGISFLTIPVFTRLLSIEDYGIYNTFIAYESVFFIIVGFSIHSTFKNAKYKYEENFERYISSSFLFICFSFFFWLLIFFIFSSVLCSVLDLDKITLIMLVLYSFSSAILQCVNTYLALNYKYRSYLLISFINAFGNITLSIFFINTVFNNSRYFGRIFGTVLPSFFLAIFILIVIFKDTRPSINSGYWKWGVMYSLPIIPHGISQVVLSQFDRIMIQKMIGAAQAGIYSFSYNIYMIVSVTTGSLTSVWEPWFYEKMHNKDYSTIKKKANIYIYAVLIFSILLMLISPEIIQIMGSKEYWKAKICVFPIIGAGFFAFLYTLPSSVEYYFEKTKYIALGTVGAAIVNIILNFIALKKYSYISAAYTTLFTYLIYFVFHYFLSRKIFEIELFDFKMIVFSIISIFVSVIMCNILIEKIVIRWTISLLIIVSSLITFLYYKRKKKEVI